LTDHTTDSLIKDSFFEKVNFGVMIVFSQRITVTGNRVLHPMSSGLQFWGNWQWARKDCADLIFANNHVWIDGPAGSCIWGTGAKRVVMNGNIADGAADVALDLEWCDDSVITGNTVRNFRNAGISLFYSCERIAITGNTVLNDWVPAKEEQAEEQKTGWWVRSGIWLTGVNRKAFKDDNGCRDVAITGNTIVCAPGIHRRTVWIEGCSENILVTGNTVKGGALWHGGGEDRDGKSSPLLPFKDGSLIVNDKEVKQYPLTAPRP
jgi:parallel beta-helix repeat protein